jgi:hypothetical protein
MNRNTKPSASSSWQPIVHGDLAVRCRRAVDTIAADLLARGSDLLPPEPARRPSLAGGAAGLALFFAYLAEDSGQELYAERATALLDEAGALLASTLTTAGLYSGFPGVAWVSEHLTGRLYEATEEDPLESIDEALLALVERSPWSGDFDLISGLAGFGLYAAERRGRPTTRRTLAAVVDRLAELARTDSTELAWYTGPELLPEHQREAAPDGFFNLGVAHGIPGVLPVLAAAARDGVGGPSTRELWAGAVRFLLAHRVDPAAGLHFAYHWAPGEAPEPCRMAWCYGDPGVAAVLVATGRALDERRAEEVGLTIALDASRRDPATSGVRDAGLCHGAAGLAHLFNRLHQQSGHPELAEAARFWLERALEYQGPGRGVGGFAALSPVEPTRPPEWQSDPGFLSGAAGVGLALLAATSTVEPQWDRVLGVSLAPITPASPVP